MVKYGVILHTPWKGNVGIFFGPLHKLLKGFEY